MPKHRKISTSRRPTRLEWIGGRISPPFYFPEGDESIRAIIAIWLESPSNLIVGQEMAGPKTIDGAVGRALKASLKSPAVGPSRSPDRIRVADAVLAEEVRSVVGDAIPIVVAATPELDEILKLMVETMPKGGEEESYFEGGRIPPEVIADLFHSARVLFALAPWKVATDDILLRLDIPALEVDGACLSIIGNLGQSLGLLIFPSLEGYEAFHHASMEFTPGEPIDLGSGWLALNFDRGADIPDSMRREVAVHDWPLAGADAYPQVSRRDSDGYPRPLTVRDVKIASACASALSAFFIKHGDVFGQESFKPVSESYFDNDDLEVRFMMPYESSHMFGLSAPGLVEPDWSSRLAETGRNDPCPCGSGRK